MRRFWIRDGGKLSWVASWRIRLFSSAAAFLVKVMVRTGVSFWREDRASWAMRWVLPDPAEAKRKMSELVEAIMDLS